MLRLFQCESLLVVTAEMLVWQVFFYFIGFFQLDTGSLGRYWLHPTFTLYTIFLYSDADGIILYSDKQKYEEKL